MSASATQGGHNQVRKSAHGTTCWERVRICVDKRSRRAVPGGSPSVRDRSPGDEPPHPRNYLQPSNAREQFTGIPTSLTGLVGFHRNENAPTLYTDTVMAVIIIIIIIMIIIIQHLYSALKSCKGYGGAGTGKKMECNCLWNVLFNSVWPSQLFCCHIWSPVSLFLPSGQSFHASDASKKDQVLQSGFFLQKMAFQSRQKHDVFVVAVKRVGTGNEREWE